MSLKLRDLIKKVRACKTAAEERAIIARESSDIRSSFNDPDGTNRHRNIAKLLYIHMLGYPTYFGQMECLKLIVSPFYSDKRIGYLGLMLLLDEKQEVLTLVTNTLQNDMKHTNHYIVGLALCALGNIASIGIARDLSSDVEGLMQSTSPYIRKKAALAAIRIIRKCPDLAENFAAKVRPFFQNEKNHGVLLAGSALVLEILQAQGISEEIQKDLAKIVPFVVKVLKTLVTTGYVPEYDVNGVTDPFLQVKLLRLLRVLGTEQIKNGDPKATEQMADILAQVATNTESARNVGNAVLYECVQTILGIPSENGLRVLAINVLGRFLTNRDNNIRYVALNTLQRVVSNAEPGSDGAQAIQRHRQTIVDCLKDPDISIRRRALDLVYALVDESNVRQLTHDLLNYLVVADEQFRADVVAKLCFLVEKFAPSKRWQFDTTIRVVSIGGNTVPDEVPASICAIIAQNTEIQAYAVQRLYTALVKDISNPFLTCIGLWSIGEYADYLVGNLAPSTADSEEEHSTASPSQVLDLIDSTLRSPFTTPLVLQYAINCLVKLTVRLPDGSVAERARKMISRYQDSIILEVQQRSCEFGKLFNYPKVKADVWDRIPAPEEKEKDSTTSPAPGGVKPIVNLPTPAAGGASQDVLGDILGLGAPATSPVAAAPAKSGDVLADLLGGGLAPAASPAASAAKPANALDALFGGAPATSTVAPAAGGLDSLLGGLTPAAAAPAAISAPSLTVYNKNSITVALSITHPNAQPYSYDAQANITTSGQVAVTDCLLRVAVPKWIKMELESASSTTVPANNSGKITQMIHLTNTTNGASPVMLRFKLNCRVGASNIDETFESAFPQSI